MKPLCDLTVLIYHGGFECDLETGKPLTASAENQACRMCRELDFDLVLTGHQHMRVDGVHLDNSFAVQPAYRAPHCCGVTVTVEDDGSKRFESRIIPADGRPLERAYNLLHAAGKARADVARHARPVTSTCRWRARIT